MSDLIRREDVIEVLMETIAPTTLTLNTLVMRINSLPSAETHDKRTETHSVCSDLIRRSDAMGAVQDHFNADGFKGYDDGQKMLDRLKALPSAEARPTGEWIFNTSTSNGKSWNVCSECGESIFHQANFCPNCGADMRGGESDD